ETLDMRLRSVLRARDNQPAYLAQQARAGFALDLPPQFVRTHHQRRQVIALADRKARHARVAMRRPVRMRRIEPIEADHFGAALRELQRRGASHVAKAENSNVVIRHGTPPRISDRNSLPEIS